MTPLRRLWLVLALLLTGAPAPLQAEQALVINTAALPPLTRSADGTGGHHERMLDEMFRRIGRSVSLLYVPAERALINADRGIEDGNLVRLRFVETLYDNLIAVPEPIMDFQFAAFTTDPDLTITGWDSFAPFDVAFITGWKILEQNITEARSIQTVAEPDHLFNLLGQGRADVVVYEKWQGLHKARQAGLKGLRMVPLHLPPQPMFLLLNTRHANIVEPLADSLRAMKADGTFQRITSETLEPTHLD